MQLSALIPVLGVIAVALATATVIPNKAAPVEYARHLINILNDPGTRQGTVDLNRRLHDINQFSSASADYWINIFNIRSILAEIAAKAVTGGGVEPVDSDPRVHPDRIPGLTYAEQEILQSVGLLWSNFFHDQEFKRTGVYLQDRGGYLLSDIIKPSTKLHPEQPSIAFLNGAVPSIANIARISIMSAQVILALHFVFTTDSYLNDRSYPADITVKNLEMELPAKPQKTGNFLKRWLEPAEVKRDRRRMRYVLRFRLDHFTEMQLYMRLMRRVPHALFTGAITAEEVVSHAPKLDQLLFLDAVKHVVNPSVSTDYIAQFGADYAQLYSEALPQWVEHLGVRSGIKAAVRKMGKSVVDNVRFASYAVTNGAESGLDMARRNKRWHQYQRALARHKVRQAKALITGTRVKVDKHIVVDNKLVVGEAFLRILYAQLATVLLLPQNTHLCSLAQGRFRKANIPSSSNDVFVTDLLARLMAPAEKKSVFSLSRVKRLLPKSYRSEATPENIVKFLQNMARNEMDKQLVSSLSWEEKFNTYDRESRQSQTHAKSPEYAEWEESPEHAESQEYDEYDDDDDDGVALIK